MATPGTTEAIQVDALAALIRAERQGVWDEIMQEFSVRSTSWEYHVGIDTFMEWLVTRRAQL